MIPPGETVQLLVRQQVVLQEAGGEARVREPVGHRDQRHQWRAQVLDAVQVLLSALSGGWGRRVADHGNVVFWWWWQAPCEVLAPEVFADWGATV